MDSEKMSYPKAKLIGKNGSECCQEGRRIGFGQ
jgi:hypothetical protein